MNAFYALLLAALTQAVPQALLIPANTPTAFPGIGVCSQTNVTNFNYTFSTSSPGVVAVLACNLDAYQDLLNANLYDPATARLNPPLLDMSCYQGAVTSCSKALGTRKIRSQIMCVLVKGGLDKPMNGTLDVVFSP
jgi:hypothetical protein